jgi:hypothetical protein
MRKVDVFESQNYGSPYYISNAPETLENEDNSGSQLKKNTDMNVVAPADIIPTPLFVIQNFQPQMFPAKVQPEKNNTIMSTMIAPLGVNQNMQPQIYNASVQPEKNNNVMSTITPTHCVNQFMVDIRLHVFINTVNGSYSTHYGVVLITYILDLRLHVLIYTGKWNHSTHDGVVLLRLNTGRVYLRLKFLVNNKRSLNKVVKRHNIHVGVFLQLTS